MTHATICDVLAEGRHNALELVEQSLAEVDRVQAATNAFISVDADSARAAARRLDAEPPRLLGGIPMAHKDMFDRKNHSSSFGSAHPRIQPHATAPTISSIEEAGSVTIGSLNMSEFALGATGHNRVFGHCRNPWDSAYITGGSSSGSAAAVASGVVYAALGSDTGGSIRIPAACCGVTGLKPTQGLVSQDGALALSPSLDCIGPIARSARDCALILDLIAGTQNPNRPLVGRIAYPAQAIDNIHPEIRCALERAISVFRDCGVDAEERPLPEIEPLHDLAELVQRSESSAVHYDRLSNSRSLYSPRIRRRIEAGLFISATAYFDAICQRSAHRSLFLRNTLTGTDALLIPTVDIPVPTIVETDEELSGTLPNLVKQMTHWTRWLNYLGLPAISIPCGFDSNGLPIGLQLVGRPDEEGRLLALAIRFQEMTDWHSRRPTLA